MQVAPSSRKVKALTGVGLGIIPPVVVWSEWIWAGTLLLVAALGVGELMANSKYSHGKPLTHALMWVFGLQIVIGLGYGVYLRTLPAWLPLIGLTVVASVFSDIGSWYFGGRFGTKGTFFPGVSPNKSLAGFVAGWLTGSILSGIVLWLAWRYGTNLDYEKGVFLVVTIPVVSVAGDLFASKLKRLLGIKDFGNAIPEHGGFCDRLDSLTLAALWSGTVVIAPHLLWHLLIALLTTVFLIKEK